jgi:hypothetical protein
VLSFYVDGLISPEGNHNDGTVQAGWIRAAKPSIAIRIPPYQSADTIVVTKINVTVHANLVAVVKNGRARKGKKQTIEQLDAPAIVVSQRS